MAALMVSTRSLSAALRSNRPWRSSAGSNTGIITFRRFPHTRSEASHNAISATLGHSRRVHVRAFRHEKQESWFVQRGITITGMPSRMLRNPIRLSSSGQRPYTQLFYFAIFRPAASSLLAQVVSPRPGKGQHERVKVSAGVVLRELYRRAEPTHSRIVGELARLLPFSGGVTVTSIVLIVMLPVMLMVAALIRIVMGGPVIFAQDRIGLGGRVFTCYKFRTMVAGVAGRTSVWVYCRPSGCASRCRRRISSPSLGKAAWRPRRRADW